MAEEEPDLLASRLILTRLPMVFSVLVFGFGLTAGILLAFSTEGMQDSAGLIISVFLVLIGCTLILGAAVFAFRKPLWRRVFGVAESHLEQFATPLARVAQYAAERDPTGAVKAAGELVQLGLARYAWLSTRRWVLASLTGLIAAMAALSGTALLFRQNQLIEVQSQLLSEQNLRIVEQTVLLEQQVELAEAARNAELAIEITNIAALLGAALDAVQPDGGRAGDIASLVPVLDPVTDISQSLRMRIISASRAAKPYRFLEAPLRAHDTTDKIRVASARRKDDLPGFYADSQAGFRWTEPPDKLRLIDRPASPERGNLLQVMVGSGLRDLETLNFYGLDLSFAMADDMSILGVSMQQASLSYASFRRTAIMQSDFGGAALENSRFEGARLDDTSFSAVDADNGKGPWAGTPNLFATSLGGASFRDSYLRGVDFIRGHLMTANFDAATLDGVDFSGAFIGGATFRGAVIVEADFTGAGLQSVDFDGAFVIRGDFLDWLTAQAAPGTFRPERFEIAPSTSDALFAVNSAFRELPPERLGAGAPAVWRITRVGDFE
jgi:uncharacterized protein YjbI with pentapeptide repeats